MHSSNISYDISTKIKVKYTYRLVATLVPHSLQHNYSHQNLHSSKNVYHKTFKILHDVAVMSLPSQSSHAHHVGIIEDREFNLTKTWWLLLTRYSYQT